jgi:hypothetical protein
MDPAGPAAVSMDSQSIHGPEFAVCKHKADLLYHQRDYRRAAMLYKDLLSAVPVSNNCVTREVRDGFARCCMKLGEVDLAKREAEKLVRRAQELAWPLVQQILQ